MVNVNEKTGIRYGIIASRSLEYWVIDEIQMNGTDVHWEEAVEDQRREVKRDVEWGSVSEEDFYKELDRRIEALSENFYDDEPVHEFDIKGVKGRTTWLGGALLVWVFESPYKTYAQLCSPCVPNCGDLDSLDDSTGELCYDVPPEWRREEAYYDDSMDGDEASALASAGFGTDEDYGG